MITAWSEWVVLPIARLAAPSAVLLLCSPLMPRPDYTLSTLGRAFRRRGRAGARVLVLQPCAFVCARSVCGRAPARPTAQGEPGERSGDTPSPRSHLRAVRSDKTVRSCGRARRVDRNHSNVYSLCRLSTHLRRTDQEREARESLCASPARVFGRISDPHVDTAPAPWHTQPFHARRAERVHSIQPRRVDCSSLRAQACGHSKPRHVGRGGLVEMRLADQLREQRDQQLRWADGRVEVGVRVVLEGDRVGAPAPW